MTVLFPIHCKQRKVDVEMVPSLPTTFFALCVPIIIRLSLSYKTDRQK